jgi:hypothetical protein
MEARMSNLSLYSSIGGVVFLALISYLFRSKPQHMMLGEWRERMKKLDTEKPLKSRIEGKPGVSSSVKVRKEKKVVAIRKTVNQ